MRKITLFVLAILFIFSLLTTEYRLIAVAVTVLVLVRLIDKFSKGILLLEIMGIYACLIYLVAPILGYSIYNKNNRIARIWIKFMPVPEHQYFEFVLPAVILYLIGLFIWMGLKELDEGDAINLQIRKVTNALNFRNFMGQTLVLIGAVFFFIKDSLPGGLSHIGSLFYMMMFPGVLYIYFGPQARFKPVFYFLVIALIGLEAVRTSMFTTVFYMGLSMGAIIFLKRRLSLTFKLFGLAFLLIFTMSLQLAKIDLRKARSSSDEDPGIGLFVDRFTSNLFEIGGTSFSPNAFFPVFTRLNQGFNAGLVLKRIPSQKPHDNGKAIYRSILASFVPRVFWPDKPQAGGQFNMEYYAGVKIRGYSTNVGPIGEAYGSFGMAGGFVYILFFGGFIGFYYFVVLKLSNRFPLLVLWTPMIFYEVLFSMENDTLQAFNSTIKMAIFLVVFFRLFPVLLKGSTKG